MFAHSAAALARSEPNEPRQLQTHLNEVFAPAARVDALPFYGDVDAVIEDLKPSEPVFCIDAGKLREAALGFLSFPGRALYAVKCNPHPFVLKTLFDAGIVDFDVASLDEVKQVDRLFGKSAGQFFNNPAKSRPAIRSASHDHGIRFYTADCPEEVEKILQEASSSVELVVAVRLATRSTDARYVLSSKFGASPDQAARMMRMIHGRGIRTGISFHVGSQCLSPGAFTSAIELAARVTRSADVPLNVLNVGGGFPAPYPGDRIQDQAHYMGQIMHALRKLDLPRSCILLCEPGRSLVATAGTTLVQVVMRRDRTIFLNDGVFGTLQELGHPKERRPVRLIKNGGRAAAPHAEFKVFGPTCDSNDVLGAPFSLPDDVTEGDWIEIGMMGAYSLSMRTHFNGFFADKIVSIGTR